MRVTFCGDAAVATGALRGKPSEQVCVHWSCHASRRGHTLRPYEIVAPAGAGGMGEVYRARDTRLNREVAINVARPSLR